VSDNVAGARSIARHLYNLGHRQVGLLGGPLNTSTGRDRASGFSRFFQRRASDGCAVTSVEGDFSYDAGLHGIRRLLDYNPDVTAVFAGNDTMAMGAINGLIELGLRVPDDVSIVGFDDIPMAGWPIWNLTTAAQPTQEMAKVGVQLLLARVQEPRRMPEQRVFATALRLRGTTAAPRVGGN